MVEFLIAAGFVGMMYWFVHWAEKKKVKDQNNYPSAKRLDEFEEKIS